MKPTGPTNPVLRRQIAVLEKAYRKTKRKLYKDLAERLITPRRRRSQVNLLKIDRYAKEGDVVIVPGKVLGYGNLSKKITIVAASYSKNALNKVNLSGSKIIDFEEFVSRDDIKNIKILE